MVGYSSYSYDSPGKKAQTRRGFGKCCARVWVFKSSSNKLSIAIGKRLKFISWSIEHPSKDALWIGDLGHQCAMSMQFALIVFMSGQDKIHSMFDFLPHVKGEVKSPDLQLKICRVFFLLLINQNRNRPWNSMFTFPLGMLLWHQQRENAVQPMETIYKCRKVIQHLLLSTQQWSLSDFNIYGPN